MIWIRWLIRPRPYNRDENRCDSKNGDSRPGDGVVHVGRREVEREEGPEVSVGVEAEGKE